MLKLPNIPPKEELQFKEKEFLLSVYEQFGSSRKIWFIILLAVLALAVPGKIILEKNFSQSLVGATQPFPINNPPYIPQELTVSRASLLPVAPGIFSAYAQVINPNAEISAKAIDYQFIFKRGQEIETVSAASYLLAGESKFLLLPLVELPEQARMEFKLGDVKWTARRPQVEVKLEVLQKNTGLTPEGKFFVEGLVKNPHGFGIRVVEVPVVIFDRASQEIIAVNATVLSDLKAGEARYFRVIWPDGSIDISAYQRGQIEVTPTVNLLDPGLVLEESEKIPPR